MTAAPTTSSASKLQGGRWAASVCAQRPASDRCLPLLVTCSVLQAAGLLVLVPSSVLQVTGLPILVTGRVLQAAGLRVLAASAPCDAAPQGYEQPLLLVGYQGMV